MERAAEGHHEHLEAEADAERRHALRDRGPRRLVLELLALRIHVSKLRAWLVPVARGMDVPAAGQHQTVDARERTGALLRTEEHRHAARGVHRRSQRVLL